MGVLVKEKEGRPVSEVCLQEETESRLGYSNRDIITVSIRDEKEEWWVSDVYMGVEGAGYMGVEGAGNREQNRKMYSAFLEINRRIENKRWNVMGDFNAHVGLNNKPVNQNGHMLLDFTDATKLKIMN